MIKEDFTDIETHYCPKCGAWIGNNYEHIGYKKDGFEEIIGCTNCSWQGIFNKCIKATTLTKLNI